MAALTVTATATESSGATGLLLRVKVLRNAAATQNGATAGGASGVSQSFDQSITVSAIGSYVYGAAANFTNNTSFTADGATTLIDNVANASGGDQWGTFRSTATTSSTGAQTYGCSAPTGQQGAVALAEILAAAGLTLTEDASGPAVVSSTSANAVTTASFTPPPGSLLVALVSSDGSATSATTLALSGGGLTWTALKQSAAASADYAGIFIARVPLSAPVVIAAPPGLSPARPVSRPASQVIAALASPAVTLQGTASLSGTGTLSAGELVTGPVLNANWDFETGISPWGPFPYGTAAQSTAWSLSGTHSMLFTPDGVHTSGLWSETGIAVSPGETVMFTVACYCPAGWTGSGNGVQAVLWWNTGGGSGGTLMPLSAGVVTFATVTAIVPAGVSSIQAEIAVQGIPPASTLFYFDVAQVLEVFSSAGTWYPVAALSGSGTLSAAEVQQPGVSLSGTGALSAVVTQQPGAVLSGSGALTAAVVQQPGATLSGAGSMTASAPLTGAAALSGSGTLSAVVIQQPGVSLSGSGTLSAGVMRLVTAALSGSGSLSTAVIQQPGVALSGSGILSTAAIQQATVALSGIGVLSAAAGGAVAFLSGSGTLSIGATLGAPVSLSGSGTLTAGVSWAGGASLSGAGALSAAVRQLPGASLSGAGSLSAAAAQGSGAALSGIGVLSAAVSVSVTAALSGTGALTTGTTRQVTVVLSGSGTLSAAPAATWLAAAALFGTGVLSAAAQVAAIVRDADACHGEDSGFTFITSSDTCSAAETGTPAVVDSDICVAADVELSRWVTDADVCAAADLGWYNPHTGTETCSASDGGEVIYLSDSGVYPGGDSCIATDSYAGVIDVYTFIPPLATGPGGGFEVVWTDQAGQRHLILAGSHVSKAVLELARGIVGATEVVFIRDSDGCHAAETSKPVIGVTIDVQPAVRVGIEAIRALTTANVR